MHQLLSHIKADKTNIIFSTLILYTPSQLHPLYRVSAKEHCPHFKPNPKLAVKFDVGNYWQAPMQKRVQATLWFMCDADKFLTLPLALSASLPLLASIEFQLKISTWSLI